MALYIHPENQKLLWENMLKIPIFSHIFNTSSNEHELWFKQIIQLFYQKHPHIKSKNELASINKQTILYMIKQLQQMENNTNTAHIQNPQKYIMQNDENTMMRKIKKENTDNIQMQFDLRQKEYMSLLDPQKPSEMNFKESGHDTIITNMDELIQKHMAERENDLQLFGQLKETDKSENAYKINNTMNIISPDSNNLLTSNTIQNSNIYDDMEKRLIYLEQKIVELEMKIESMQSK
jgi:hypothetical protein